MIADTMITRPELKAMIHSDKIKFGGNSRLKIYGTLSCKSGKRMKKQNRVFFSSEQEAIDNGYRPCGHCMREKYLKWMKVPGPVPGTHSGVKRVWTGDESE